MKTFFKNAVKFLNAPLILLLIFTTAPSNPAIAQTCGPNLSAQGVTCLHCMDARVKNATPRLVEALGRSCINNVALAFVVDGSFGFDEAVIRQSVLALLAKGKRVNLHIYLMNGSAIRKAKSLLFTGFLNHVPPEVFRRRIKTDKAFQDKIYRHTTRFVPLLRWAHSIGVNLSISPMLEDNLDNLSFVELLAVTKRAIPNSLGVTWVRNSCPDCYPGNQSKIPPTVVLEDHRSTVPILSGSRIVSNDGWGFISFKSEPILKPSVIDFAGKSQRSQRLSDLLALKKHSDQKGAVFLLWLSKYQSTKMGSSQTAWRDRELPVPSDEELKEITAFFDS